MENKYLLLRDNKQSGPYTLQELIEKGIKAYDLVWAEGKSAAWRYPSEIAELKPFSPVVEEQPFDRFYRRNIEAEQTVEPVQTSATSTKVADEESTFVRRPVEISQNNGTTKRKIFVTMPGGAKADRRQETLNKSAEPVANTEKEIKPTKDTTSNQSGLESSSDVQKEAEQASQYSDNTNIPKEQRKESKSTGDNSYYAAKSIKTIVEEAPEGFSSLFQEKYSVQDEKIIDIRKGKEKGSSKLAVRAIIAACLLLGGVVIGLVISYYNQKSSARDLDALVKQIQDRDKNAAANQTQQASVPATLPIDTHQVSASDLITAQEQEAHTTPAEKSAVAGKKEDKKQNAGLPVSDITEDKSSVTPQAPSKEPETAKANPEKQVNAKSDVAIESAKKNIYSLVGVEGTKYKTGVLGGISDLKLTISNNSLFQLDRVEVEIRYFGPEKRVVKTQSLLFNDIAAGAQRTLEAPKTSRGVSVEYSIRSIDSKELGLAHSGF